MTWQANGESIVSSAIDAVRDILWDEITYNGVTILAKVWSFPQANAQTNLYNDEYQIEFKAEDATPVDNCPVIIRGVSCISGQVVDKTTTLTWTVRCPKKGS